ncbi:STAS domain-containing protein [Devosia epidermidihirudinis]|nr:STAS domain-containing protein [Devosia epidermidihirudinis]
MGNESTQSIALPAIMDLDSLDGVRDGMLDALEAGPVCVRGDAVERVSTNALLILISAAETARRNHYEFQIEQPSAALFSAIERLGLKTQFSGMIKA